MEFSPLAERVHSSLETEFSAATGYVVKLVLPWWGWTPADLYVIDAGGAVIVTTPFLTTGESFDGACTKAEKLRMMLADEGFDAYVVGGVLVQVPKESA